MDQIVNELKKMVKAGMGAVATGIEKGQEAIDAFAKKGEPIYQQAKSAVADAAGKVKQAVNDGIQSVNDCKPDVEELLDKVTALSREEWEAFREAVDDFFDHAGEPADQEKDGAADADEAEKAVETEEPEKTPDPMDMAESMRTEDEAADNRPED